MSFESTDAVKYPTHFMIKTVPGVIYYLDSDQTDYAGI